MRLLKRLLLFLCANFLALAVGVYLMKNGPITNWYLSLDKAPWSPPNWLFGVAWSCIMVCFSFYMAKLSLVNSFMNKKIIILYIVQWLLNVGWNYVFFNQHLTVAGLIVIVLLWLLIGYMTFEYIKKFKWYSLLIAPYLVWMTIATSLNAYIVFNN